MPVIDCVALAEKKRKEYEDAGKLKDRACLHIIQIGDNPVNNLYLKSKMDEADKWNVEVIIDRFNKWDSSFDDIYNHIRRLNDCNDVDGIIIQLPTDLGDDREAFLTSRIDICKDVDGFVDESYFTPCTPKGIMWLLEDIGYEGDTIGIIGRGKLVGAPLLDILRYRSCTLIEMNSSTDDIQLGCLLKNCDIVISAVGKPKFFNSIYLDYGTVYVIDAGVSRIDGKQVGDFDHALTTPFVHYTPWTKGVGKLTVAALMANVRDAHEYKEFRKSL